MDEQFTDITGASIVEVQIRHDSQVVWIHVDGRTRLRICRIEQLVVTDARTKPEPVDD